MVIICHILGMPLDKQDYARINIIDIDNMTCVLGKWTLQTIALNPAQLWRRIGSRILIALIRPLP
jgi:hypothetical protein